MLINNINKATYLILIVLILSISTQEDYYKIAPECPRPLYGPVNIGRPMSYTAFNIDIELNDTYKNKIIKINPYMFVIENNLGFVYYAELTFQVERMYFKFPSDTTIGGIRYSLEIIIECFTKDNRFMQISKLFELHPDISDDYLKQFEFSELSKMNNFQFKSFSRLNLKQIFNYENSFFMYEGQSINNICRIGVIVVCKDTGLISNNIINLFGVDKGGYNMSDMKIPKNLIQNFYNPKKSLEIVNTSFDKAILIYKNYGFTDKKIENEFVPIQSDFPVEYQYNGFMYKSFNETLGVIPPYATPFWVQVNKEIEYIPYPKTYPGYKTFPFYFLPSYNNDKLVPVYIVIPKNVTFSNNAMPNSIPILIRSNFKYKNFVRPLIEVNMNIFIGNNTIINEIKQNSNEKITNETLKNQGNYHIANITNNNTNNDTYNLSQINNNNYLDNLFADGNIIIKENIIQYCNNYELHDIINIPYNDLLAWERYHITQTKFKNERRKCIKTFEFKMKHVLESFSDGPLNIFNRDLYNKNLNLLLKYCKNELHVILNRHYIKDMTDYIKHNCNGKILENENHIDNPINITNDNIVQK